MISEINDILIIGFFEGLKWFPFVLTIGILFKYLKFIDISIDGIVVISSILFTIIWNNTHSLFISFSCTSLTAVILYSIVSFLIYELKINTILAGIIFTLILHSLSVILIGESLSLDYSLLFFLDSPLSYFFIVALLIICTEYFFRSNLGIKIKVASDNYNVNVPANPRILILMIYIVAGLILSVGVVVYTSNLGLSRSGGGFEFLITSLSSFLFVDRIIDFFISIINKSRPKFSYKRYLFFSYIQSPVFKALIGSVFFQIIVLLIIFYTANPAYWKLIFGIILLFTVAKLGRNSLMFGTNKASQSKSIGLTLSNLYFEYDNGYEKLKIFENLNCHFATGVHIIWGDNGAGKTSLLKLMTGELKPTEGAIYKDGQDVTNYNKLKRNIFYIAQNPFSSLSINSTVFENISASKRFKYLSYFKISSPNTALHFIKSSMIKNTNDAFEMNDSFWVQNVSNVSGGQAQKVNLLISSVSETDTLLADEPTSGMDQNNYDLFLNYIKQLENKINTIIIVSHDSRLKDFPANHYQMQNGHLRKVEYHVTINKSVNSLDQ